MSLPKKNKECKGEFLGIILAFWKRERKARRDCRHRKKKWPEGKKQESVVSLNYKAKESLRRQAGGSKRGQEKRGLRRGLGYGG